MMFHTRRTLRLTRAWYRYARRQEVGRWLAIHVAMAMIAFRGCKNDAERARILRAMPYDLFEAVRHVARERAAWMTLRRHRQRFGFPNPR